MQSFVYMRYVFGNTPVWSFLLFFNLYTISLCFRMFGIVRYAIGSQDEVLVGIIVIEISPTRYIFSISVLLCITTNYLMVSYLL
jgi:hypothetical protein